MLTLPTFDERAIWLVPLGFYILDSLCLIDDRHIIVLENYRLQWTFKLSKFPFEFAGKHLYLLPPLLPFLFAFKLPWLIVDEVNTYKITRYHRNILAWRTRLFDFRVIAGCSWINLFLVGPIMTYAGGFIFALKIVLPIHLVLLILCMFLIVLKSHVLNFNQRMILTYLIELTLSPGYLPNICRRLSLNYARGDVDGVMFLKRYGPRSTAELMLDIIQFRLAEMKSVVGENPEDIRNIEKYSAELRL